MVPGRRDAPTPMVSTRDPFGAPPSTIAALSVLRALAGSARDAADWADSRALAALIAGECPVFAAEAARINAEVAARLAKGARR